MLRPLPTFSRHALPALLAIAASLAVPVLTAADGVTGSATNVSARAAQAAERPERPGGELFPVESPAFQTAHRIAGEQWGAAPCKGEVAISWQPLDAGTNGTASWRNPTDAWNNASENFDCVIELNTNAGYDLPKLCTVLAHELGHLHGQQHAQQRGLLMSPIYSDALPACAAAAPAPAPAPEPAAPPAGAVEPAAARPAGTARSARIVKTFVKTTTTAKGVKVTDTVSRKRTLRKGGNRCIRTLRAGRSAGRCAGIARRAVVRPARSRR